MIIAMCIIMIIGGKDAKESKVKLGVTDRDRTRRNRVEKGDKSICLRICFPAEAQN